VGGVGVGGVFCWVGGVRGVLVFFCFFLRVFFVGFCCFWFWWGGGGFFGVFGCFGNGRVPLLWKGGHSVVGKNWPLTHGLLNFEERKGTATK